MTFRRHRVDSGFTLIELVIVLAVGALILAGVFAAVSGAQKSSRDNQRKRDLGAIVADLLNYSSQNNGFFPDGTDASVAAFTNVYITGKRFDPLTGNSYDFYRQNNRNANVGEIQYAMGHICVNNQPVNNNLGRSHFALYMGLETTGAAVSNVHNNPASVNRGVCIDNN